MSYFHKSSLQHTSIATLKPYANNARVHSPKQIQTIMASIEEFGFTNPVLINKDKMIIAGHGRVEAARQLGLTEVPTICLEHLTEDQVRAYILADNKLAQLAEWDNDILAIELQGLLEIEADFDIEVTGFETAEIDLILETALAENQVEDCFEPPDPDIPTVSRPGDIWALGPHLLLCGNALKKESYESLLGEKRAKMIFTDPPYNVSVDGHVCGSGNIKHREFVMGSGEMSEEEFEEFLFKSFKHMADFSTDGSLHFIFMDWRGMYTLLSAGRKVFNELKNLIIWNKTNAGMGTFYRSKHELVFVFKHGTAKHQNNFGLGENGRYRSNVWDYAGVNTFRKGRLEDLADHPTVKPLALVADAIRDCSKRGDIILDPFAGSGTTLIAAHETGRVARCIELDPIYVDTIIRRFQKKTGDEAGLFNEGWTFSEAAEMRGVKIPGLEEADDD